MSDNQNSGNKYQFTIPGEAVGCVVVSKSGRSYSPELSHLGYTEGAGITPPTDEPEPEPEPAPTPAYEATFEVAKPQSTGTEPTQRLTEQRNDVHIWAPRVLYLAGHRVDELYISDTNDPGLMEISGGTVGYMNSPKDKVFTDLYIHDVTFDGSWDDGFWERMAMSLRATRCHIAWTTMSHKPKPNSPNYIDRYGLWIERCSDLLIERNDWATAGSEACVRLNDVERAIVVDNEFASYGVKHSFRIHGQTGAFFVSRNRMKGRGVYIGGIIGQGEGARLDHLEDVVFSHNTIEMAVHTAPILVAVHGATVVGLTMQGNHVKGGWNPWPSLEQRARDNPDWGWTIEGNTWEPGEVS